jgi:hypothetical protein
MFNDPQHPLQAEAILARPVFKRKPISSEGLCLFQPSSMCATTSIGDSRHPVLDIRHVQKVCTYVPKAWNAWCLDYITGVASSNHAMIEHDEVLTFTNESQMAVAPPACHMGMGRD